MFLQFYSRPPFITSQTQMFRHKDSVNLRERIVQGAAYNSDNIKKHKALLFEKAAHGRKLWSLAFQRGD